VKIINKILLVHLEFFNKKRKNKKEKRKKKKHLAPSSASLSLVSSHLSPTRFQPELQPSR
jgi:hypothetical protein